MATQKTEGIGFQTQKTEDIGFQTCLTKHLAVKHLSQAFTLIQQT
jgi:hypothetical protein